MTLAKALQVAAGNSQESADIAEAIDFDGTNDYLSRASDLVGNTDGKTFTFSAWVWDNIAVSGNSRHLYVNFDGSFIGFRVYYLSTAGQLVFTATNSAGTAILNISISAAQQLLKDTFNNILVSVDLANASNRYAYINDVAASFTVTTYINDTIDFTKSTSHTVAANQLGAGLFKGRLSNVYLDYTYRDLSIEANRRLFVTADLKPAAGQAALNPILYLPMDDPTAPGVNAGTGGNFTLTGTVARSGRGPNQYNAPYSDLDGTADYLSRTTAPTGIADGKTFTIHAVVNVDGESPIFSIATSTTLRFMVKLTPSAGFFNISVEGRTSSNSVILNASTGYIYAPKRNLTIEISVDLSNSAKRHFLVNGENASVTWTTYTNNDIQFSVTSTPNYRIGRDNGTVYLDGRLGALWFNTSYIDLSVADNLAKFVTGTGIDAKPVDLGATGELPTGTAPIIYLPMYGNNAGKNYGTGGDFTVNSGPYTGARGPNEFWAASVNSANNSNYMIGANSISSKTITLVLSLKSNTDGNNEHIYFSSTSNGTNRGSVKQLFGNQALEIDLYNSAGTKIVDTTAAGVLSNSQWRTILFSVDMTNSSKRHLYVNGSSPATTWGAYTNDFISFDFVNLFTGTGNDGTNQLAVVYCADGYVDFSQEANRLKFVDAFGYYTDLTSKIESGDIPTPLVYLKFDQSALGVNSGTGGDFSITGTITPAGYATPT